MAYGRGRRPAVGLLLGLVVAANLFATLEGQGQDPAAAQESYSQRSVPHDHESVCCGRLSEQMMRAARSSSCSTKP